MNMTLHLSGNAASTIFVPHRHASQVVPIIVSKAMMSSVSSSNEKTRHVLTVAGSDSGAGAGIQADMKACAALGVYCSTAITAITAQNTKGVQGIHVVPDDIFSMQLESVLSDMKIDVVKTGMLPTAKTIYSLCEKLKLYPVQGLVVDPVMVATSGDILADNEIVDVLCNVLLPMADIVTPNLPEASTLIGGASINSVADMHDAAKIIKQYGPHYVLIKGGHLQGSDDVIDVLYDGETFHALHGARVDTSNTHGTGCTLASSIAAEMAKGSGIPKAVQTAKKYVQQALAESRILNIGHGQNGPLNHFFNTIKWSDKQQTQKLFKPSDLLLYAITDSNMNKKWQRSTMEAVEAAVNGGATMVQLREKDSCPREFLQEALSCVELARKKNVPILINDRLDIAMACDADGVHLGQSDIPVKHARKVLGPNKIIGISCKTAEQAQKAFLEGADYIGCGGVFPTTTKKNNETIGLEGLHRICEKSLLPVVAIGGISAANVADVFASGQHNLCGVAVISALFDKHDVSGETQELVQILRQIIKS